MAKIAKRRRGGQRRRRPQTLAQYDALPRRSQASVENVAHVVTRMRKGVLKNAAAEYGIDPRTVVRLGSPALRKTASGRYAAKASDDLLRVLVVPVHGGRVEVARARLARRVGGGAARGGAARVPGTGDDTKLRELSQTKILDASGREVPFLTDLDELERQGDLGALSFESIYLRRG